MQETSQEDVNKERIPNLFAWIGEDELGSGKIGLKQAVCPAGFIPLVAVDLHKMQQEYLTDQMQLQSSMGGKTIMLCRYEFKEVLLVLKPIKIGSG